MQVNTTWTNKNPNTVWNKLATKLGRQPTRDEVIAEVACILEAASIRGKL